jgi:hypothetical protein
LQVDETTSDERVDPGTRISISVNVSYEAFEMTSARSLQVNKEIICRPWRRGDENDDGDNPVEE